MVIDTGPCASTLASVAAVPDLRERITELWDRRTELDPADADALAVVDEAIDVLDRGEARVAEPVDGDVIVHEWLKQAVLLYLQLAPMAPVHHGPFEYVDRIPLKQGLAAGGVRALPGSIVRHGAFVDRGVVLMPSFVNIGARVGPARWSTPGRRSAPAHRSAATCTCPAGSASGACSNHRRPPRS